METQEYIGTITQKGQVTIPLAIRKHLGVKPRDQVAFRLSNKGVQLLPARLSLEETYGAVEPLSRPENWKVVIQQAHEERLQRRYGRPSRARKRKR